MKHIILFIIFQLILFMLLYKYKYYKYLKQKKETYDLMLRKLYKIGNKLNVKFFLSSGTLLGQHRNGDYIDTDYDLDIGVYKDNCSIKKLIKVKNELIKEGFIHYRTFGTYKDGLELSFRLPNTPIGFRAKLDIFVHYTEIINNKKKTYWCSHFENKKLKYRVSYFDLKQIVFNERNKLLVYIPNDINKYLTEHYGANWRVPIKRENYHYAKSPTSLVSDFS